MINSSKQPFAASANISSCVLQTQDTSVQKDTLKNSKMKNTPVPPTGIQAVLWL